MSSYLKTNKQKTIKNCKNEAGGIILLDFKTYYKVVLLLSKQHDIDIKTDPWLKRRE
jgi:hypothetical protein